MSRLTLALATVLAVFLAAPDSAGAGIGPDKDTTQDSDGDVVLTVGSDGTVTQPASGGGGTLTCIIHLHAPSFETPTDDRPLSIEELAEGSFYWLTCTDETGEQVVARFFEYAPGDIISTEELARRARSQLAVLYPEPRTSPAFTIDQIVGMETWMWIDRALWEPISASASIPGLAVTATATPKRVVWDMGDGTVVECDGPGTPYYDDRPPGEQSTDCGHVYQYDGSFTGSATVTWTVAWEATDGTSGDLADVQRTTEFPVEVVERQAVGQR